MRPLAFYYSELILELCIQRNLTAFFDGRPGTAGPVPAVKPPPKFSMTANVCDQQTEETLNGGKLTSRLLTLDH